MGGQYPSGSEYNFFGDNPLHTAHVINTWAGRITFSGTELGGHVFSGAGLLSSGPKTDPTLKGYAWYNYGKPRESWDPLTVMYAVEGLGCLFEEEGKGGRNYVFQNGSNEWRWDKDEKDEAEGKKRGEQRWLKLKVKNETAETVLDDMFLRGAWSHKKSDYEKPNCKGKEEL